MTSSKVKCTTYIVLRNCCLHPRLGCNSHINGYKAKNATPVATLRCWVHSTSYLDCDLIEVYLIVLSRPHLNFKAFYCHKNYLFKQDSKRQLITEWESGLSQHMDKRKVILVLQSP
jgi:FMN-dependent NADH-azoreductase